MSRPPAPRHPRRRIRTGDTVVVISGRDRGQTGTVREVLPEKNRVIVEGVNMIKRHTRPNMMTQASGGIVEREASIHISNVALADPKDGKATRIGVVRENGVVSRVAKRSGERID